MDDADVGEAVRLDLLEQCRHTGRVDLQADDGGGRIGERHLADRLTVPEADVEHDGGTGVPNSADQSIMGPVSSIPHRPSHSVNRA